MKVLALLVESGAIYCVILVRLCSNTSPTQPAGWPSLHTPYLYVTAGHHPREQPCLALQGRGFHTERRGVRLRHHRVSVRVFRAAPGEFLFLFFLRESAGLVLSTCTFRAGPTGRLSDRHRLHHRCRAVFHRQHFGQRREPERDPERYPTQHRFQKQFSHHQRSSELQETWLSGRL